ncbi:MAG: DNA polymerase III subunit delta [Bdellovibrionaceae bacterium]|nr:DNA polymerase III subunit delta [Bdellovibrionales bacterium]MCB9085913.1 DNA polymerase III subunit delta [Pseudobdellovibrionaceae bacterium]
MAASVAWDLRKLQKYLDKKVPGPLYLVFGDEPYLVDEAVKLLKTKALPDGVDDFSSDQFHYPETSPSHVKDAVETLTMMSPRRVVVYKIGKGLKDKEWEELVPVMEDPVPTTTFILVAEKADKRKKYFRKIKDAGVIVELKRPFDNQVASWIEYIAYRHEVELGRGVAALLQQFVGSNLGEINNEMLKLRQYLGDENRPVSEEDVMRLVSRSRIDSIFDLANAIGRRDRAHALVCLANLLEHGQNEVGALSLITRHIRILHTIREGMAAGLAGARLSSQAGVPQFFLQEYVNQSRAWSPDKINRALQALHETDRALKSSPISSHIWLENFIIRTCS